MTPEEKKAIREKREIRMRNWMRGLSWSLPVFSFTSFFGIWHDIAQTGANASASQAQAKSTSVTSNANSGVLFKEGMTNRQISNIQEQLAELGFFNHTITSYYGPVTTSAIKAFQSHYGLPVTGEVDSKTLAALQNAVKQYQTDRLNSPSSASNDDTNNGQTSQSSSSEDEGSSDSNFGTGSSGYGAGSDSQSGGVTQSQQPFPDTSSSAS
ncbi:MULTISPECIES: peptidoglycan-binding domain-containing protein [Alicyclobacillus]|uniref:Peptidoglycan-binding protein n=1 Tax=Alicyclobacillus acidoterrestris (strain ATCC 49025 / DSM 3922 / CIP 106132 / NCIMB 13137 / GD3B) TaxID=1356854 RepID=T0CJK3_ALIAG|nr:MULTISPECIES: peptidoglycan-binding domain-containing protein [Alicyclobacillus]EPZ52695.1 hypothetical protein N007_02595 [Alicyclobacillus acidoterrestris ATCC 49025]UNO48905.1 peptidoglycan-binding protein [Alicyclobacillus acidoterrestris]